MDKKEEYDKLKRRISNVRFSNLCKIVELFGFKLKGMKGSHRIYMREDVREILNFQEVKGMAKPYQVRQFLRIVENYNLLERD